MKKLALALVCLVSVAFFASCTPENPEPTIAILSEEGFVKDGDVVEVNTPVKYGFIMASNADTKCALKTLTISFQNDEKPEVINLTGLNHTHRGEVTFSLDREIVGNATITAIVTDEANRTASATIKLQINKENNLLVRAFEWVRKGLTVQHVEEMAAVGLEWKGSAKEIFATWAPAAGYTLYKFNGNWNDIKTVSDKNGLFQQAIENQVEPLTSFREITTAHSADYDVILGTVKDGEMHLIHLTRAEIETGGFGTMITATGEIK